MTTHYLLDTNLLVYAHDPGDAEKHARALALLAHLGSGRRMTLPAQALAEFSSVALRKLRPAIDPDELYRQVQGLEGAFPVLPLTAAVVLEAIRGVRDHQLSYYDAQIWAAAKLAQIPVVLSEDFATGSVLEGVTFVDPFAPTVSVASL